MVVAPSIPLADSDTLVRVSGVSKKFCLSLKKSLWYGLCDMGRELTGRRRGGGKQGPEGEDRGGLRPKEFWAVNNVSFELKRGECLGLIGRNGAGKTTLLKMLNGLIKPDAGRIEMRGRVGALIALGAGFNPILTGRENIYVNGSVLGLTKKEIGAKLDEIVDFAEIGDFIDTPVQNYSSGMAVRLGFAVASSLDPDILLVDEVLAVGDTAFQRKCLQKMMKYVDQGGSIILVSHNMHLIQSVCNRGIFLDHGQVRMAGTETEAIAAYHRQQDAITVRERTPTGEAQPSEKRPVVIRKVTVSGVGGGEIAEGSGISICLEYVALQTGIEVNWGLSVWTSDQLLRLFTCTDRYDASRGALDLRGRIVCEIKDWMLVGGRYALKVGVYDYQSSWPIHRIGWEDAPVFFEVKPAIREISGRRLTDGDLIAVASKWQYLPQSGIQG